MNPSTIHTARRFELFKYKKVIYFLLNFYPKTKRNERRKETSFAETQQVALYFDL